VFFLQSAVGESPTSEPPPPAQLAIVIVNFDSGDFLRNCIAQLRQAAPGVECQVVVVDNASVDGSLEGVTTLDPGVRIVVNPSNLGYGKACNLGAAATTAPFVCFLNPDIVAMQECFTVMLKAIEARPRVGVLGPRLNNPDGSRYPSCRVVPSIGVAIGHSILGLITSNNRFTRAYHLNDSDNESEREVDWVSGAAMMMRREVFNQVGGFDEGFFMYLEDVDLCARVREAGWTALYYPGAVMMHHVAGSSRRTPYKMILHHHVSLLRYAVRRTRGPSRLALPAVAAGIGLRLLVMWARHYLTAKHLNRSD
jgi:N-acetylglucosaminyl-diphospho-decaprenol L-rhamnosyltransferase